MSAKPPFAILFVCLGNICRSPLAEGAFRAVAEERGLADALEIDSAGVGAWHVGAPPDPRSVATARRHGIDISTQSARQIAPGDFARFDLLLGMDGSNVEALRARAPADVRGQIDLFSAYAAGSGSDVPDPYYGGDDGFDTVYRMIREASEVLADRLAARAPSPPASGHASSTT